MDKPSSSSASQDAEIRNSGFLLGNWRVLSCIVFLLVTGVTLAFGLVPHDDYAAKWVNSPETREETVFGGYGIAHGNFPVVDNVSGTNNNLELHFELLFTDPGHSTFQVLTSFGQPNDPEPIVVGQWRTKVYVLQGQDFSNEQNLPRLSADISEHLNQPVKLRVLFSDSRNVLYLDGEPVSVHSPSTYSIEKPNRVISIGNSLKGRQGWTGGILKLRAIHWETDTAVETVLLDYDFKNADTTIGIFDKSPNNHHLTIPPVGNYPEKLFLNDRKVENLLTGSPFDLIINLVGFFPLAFSLLFLFDNLLPSIPAAIKVVTTLAFGVCVSLIIEYQQQFIPSRNSDLHDLVLNTSGVFLGIFLYYLLRRLVLREAMGKLKQFD